MTKIEQFFYDNAGYAYNPATETEQQARVDNARNLASAEEYAREENYHFDWDTDTDGCSCEDSRGHSVEYCQLWDANREHLLASLSGICGATDDYRRVVEAELALEARARINGGKR